ncbi:high-affinity Na(+)/H(+) antiporter NhaS3 [bacterium BMS3Bbin07]|nr:high-affinity Na(+)/H(+) antiporter NhaS3 [bacterium BMS3Bbin07]
MGEQLLIMFVVIGGAAVIPFFSRKFMLPSAALEIIYGIVLFSVFLSRKPEWFSLLKDIGFIYLMFIAGMELDIRGLMRQGRFFWYVLISALSLLLTPLIFIQMGYSFYIGIAVSVVSAGIIIPVLKESGMIRTDIGQDIIGVALTGELLSIIVLTGIDIYHRLGLTVMAGVEGLKLLLLLGVAAVFLRILYVIAWWHPERIENVMESNDPVEEGIRAVISIAFAGALIAYGSGVEPILGSFMAGLIFSYVFKSKGRFEDKINAVGFGFFTPFFFIGVGADFDPGLLKSLQGISFSLFLTLMVFVSNAFPLFLARFMGLGSLEAVGMSLILSAPLSMIVVAGTLGVRMGLLTPGMNGSLILTAIISSIIYPSLFRAVSRRMGPSSKPLQPM